MVNEGVMQPYNSKILQLLILLFLLKLVSAYTHPYYGEGQYFRGIPIRSYIPVPMTHYRNEYRLPEYDDGLIANPQDDYEYNMYDRYPYAQYFAYRPEMEDYYYDKSTRRNQNGYGYFDGQGPRDEVDGGSVTPKSGFYPYGQESWYEEDFPRYDSNAKANAAFIQNLMMAQMYQDARNQYAPVYDSSADDYDDQHWVYGVPKFSPDEKDIVNEYKDDEEVKELESLARKSENKIQREKDAIKTRKFGNKNQMKHIDSVETPTKSKSKMTDDEYFDLQKQIIVNSRKNKYTPITKSLKFNKKKFYTPVDMDNNFWEGQSKKSWQSHLESATNSIKKINLINNPTSLKEVKVSESQTKVETTTAPATSTPTPKRPPSIGQKEVVLPRPSNPVRKPFAESTRSLRESSIYEELEKLLNANKDFQKSTIARPQKRFVSSEDQLTAQLTGLKKFSD